LGILAGRDSLACVDPHSMLGCVLSVRLCAPGDVLIVGCSDVDVGEAVSDEGRLLGAGAPDEGEAEDVLGEATLQPPEDPERNGAASRFNSGIPVPCHWPEARLLNHRPTMSATEPRAN
jgi:hypothetical protein